MWEILVALLLLGASLFMVGVVKLGDWIENKDLE